MKPIIYAFILISCLLACKKDAPIITPIDPIPPVTVDTPVAKLGSVIFLLNGSLRSTYKTNNWLNKDPISIDSLHGFSFYEILQPGVERAYGVELLIPKYGPQQLINLTGSSNSLFTPKITAGVIIDLDQPIGRYILDTLQPRYVDIIKIDTLQRTIQARFEFTMYRDQYLKNYHALDHEDTIKIRDGKAHLKY
jgi:hypothetical protein